MRKRDKIIKHIEAVLEVIITVMAVLSDTLDIVGNKIFDYIIIPIINMAIRVNRIVKGVVKRAENLFVNKTCKHKVEDMFIEEKEKMLPHNGDYELYRCRCVCMCGEYFDREILFLPIN